MTKETTALLTAMGINADQNIFRPRHLSGDSEDASPQEIIKASFKDVPMDVMEHLKEIYENDLRFFQYSIDLKTLNITF